MLVRRGSNPPAHLDGSLPGDFGWDPLGLGADPDRLKWFAEVRAALQALPLLCPLSVVRMSHYSLLEQRCDWAAQSVAVKRPGSALQRMVWRCAI